MRRALAELNEAGHTVVPNVLAPEEIVAIERELPEIRSGSAGTRRLLDRTWCQDLAKALKTHPGLSPLLPLAPFAIQCTYFEKTPEQNWLVALHRDKSVPVKRRLSLAGWTGWSEKEGQVFVQPPRTVLESLVAVRVHLEPNTHENSPLEVVPRSHAHSLTEPRIVCPVPAGGALVMKPLLLHASAKAAGGVRRVLHFLFAPASVAVEPEWWHAV